MKVTELLKTGPQTYRTPKRKSSMEAKHNRAAGEIVSRLRLLPTCRVLTGTRIQKGNSNKAEEK